jgi:hypothetical protein
MLGYQWTWGLQTAIVALEDHSLEHAGGGPHAGSMRIITVNAADAPQRFDKMEWCQDRYGHATVRLRESHHYYDRICCQSSKVPMEHGKVECSHIR